MKASIWGSRKPSLVGCKFGSRKIFTQNPGLRKWNKYFAQELEGTEDAAKRTEGWKELPGVSVFRCYQLRFQGSESGFAPSIFRIVNKRSIGNTLERNLVFHNLIF